SINAPQLAELSSQLRIEPTSGVKRKVGVLTPAELVDTILAEQISRLPRGGRYNVVTNPQDWQEGQFTRVFQESKLAAETRGVAIRRIMVLADRGPNRFGGDRSEVERILKLHLAA